MIVKLIYPDLGEEIEKEIIEWLEEKTSHRFADSPSPLQYVDRLEVDR